MNSPCELWTKSTLPNGYGRMSCGRYAHRVAYEKAYGPIPEGLIVRALRNNALKTPSR